MEKLAATWRLPLHKIVISNYIMGLVRQYGAAESDLTAIGRLAAAKVPHRRVGAGKRGNSRVARIQLADLRPPSGQLRFEIALEMVGVWPLRLKFPRDF